MSRGVSLHLPLCMLPTPMGSGWVSHDLYNPSEQYSLLQGEMEEFFLVLQTWEMLGTGVNWPNPTTDLKR